jgi:NAD-dependent dihydropyrimidine dehydrogenase PreA subunit
MARILFCECGNREFVSVGKREAFRAALVRNGVPFVAVRDLCGLVAARHPGLCAALAEGPVTVVACHPRAVCWMASWALGGRAPAGLTALNLRDGDADAVGEQVRVKTDRPESWTLEGPGEGGADGAKSVCRSPCAERPDCPAVEATGEPAPPGWEPWYPVIDYHRCRQCGQCAGFCLFGVYELTADKQVHVARPASCKNNCPACARLCPEAAIIFPKCPEAPINGAEIQDESAVRAMVKVNVDQILGSDPYAALQARKQKRHRLLKEQAFSERQQALDVAGMRGPEGTGQDGKGIRAS